MMSTPASSTRVGDIGSSNRPQGREPEDERTPGRKPHTQDVPTEKIRFTQTSIDTKFRDGKLLKETLEEILQHDNPEHLVRENIPPIEVYWSSNGYYAAATGNRRLYLFKLLCESGLMKSLPVIVLTNKPKSKRTHESQEIACAQETILKEIIKRHEAASSDIPGKSDENKAESSSTTPVSQGSKHQIPAQKNSRKALATLNKNPPHEISKLTKSAERRQRYKLREKEDGREASTPPGLRPGLRKRKSESPEEKPSHDRAQAPVEINVKETFRSPNKSSEDENDNSPKRRRMTPSPNQSAETELKSATTGNSQDMEDLSIDWFNQE